MWNFYKKLISSILIVSLIFVVSACKNGAGKKTVIIIDGGGDTANFNTTASMVESEINPFPYNTLEKLIEKWEKDNPKYDVQLRRTSYGGDRSSLIPMLKRSNAPDIIYQNGSVINTDLGLGYYVAMNDYLELPNKYNDNKKWKDIYTETELAGNVANDGKYYFVNLERYAAGIIYNKTIFNDNNIKVPETFSEFIEAQEKIKNAKKTPYLASYPWYDIVLETNLFSPYLKDIDVLLKNSRLDIEEFVRAYDQNIWKIEASTSSEYAAGLRTAYEVYIDLLCQKKQFEPLGSSGYDSTTDFLMGNVGMIEATSETMRKVNYDTSKNFEIGVIGYPYIPVGEYKNENYVGAGGHCYRGSAGTATSWWITNSAVKKKTTEACVDLLMFLTAPENNNKMIGDIPGAIPLDPTAEVADYLKPLLEMYNEDFKNPNLFGWGAFCTKAALDLDYSSFILTQQNALYSKRNQQTGLIKDLDKRATLAAIMEYTEVATKNLLGEMQYDRNKWPGFIK